MGLHKGHKHRKKNVTLDSLTYKMLLFILSLELTRDRPPVQLLTHLPPAAEPPVLLFLFGQECCGSCAFPGAVAKTEVPEKCFRWLLPLFSSGRPP